MITQVFGAELSTNWGPVELHDGKACVDLAGGLTIFLVVVIVLEFAILFTVHSEPFLLSQEALNQLS